jgi:hypothetical protein
MREVQSPSFQRFPEFPRVTQSSESFADLSLLLLTFSLTQVVTGSYHIFSVTGHPRTTTGDEFRSETPAAVCPFLLADKVDKHAHEDYSRLCQFR